MPGTASAALIAISRDEAANDSVLYQVDLNTGSATRLFGTGIEQITGIAFHPTTGVLYAHQNDRSFPLNSVPQSKLYRIDTASREATVIGSTEKNLTDLTFTPNGTLYGWAGGNNHDEKNEDGTSTGLLNDLVTINLVTGEISYVGDSGLDVTNRAGLASDTSGNLFLKVGAESSPATENGTIHSINVATGLATNPVTTGLATNSLAIDPDTGIAYTVNIVNIGGTGSVLKTIDLTNGTLVSKPNTVQAKFTSLAFGNVTSVPEPSSLAMLCAASCVPLLVRMRKRVAAKLRRPSDGGAQT